MRIRIRDTGWKKIWIRDKHPGSATLSVICSIKSAVLYPEATGPVNLDADLGRPKRSQLKKLQNNLKIRTSEGIKKYKKFGYERVWVLSALSPMLDPELN